MRNGQLTEWNQIQDYLLLLQEMETTPTLDELLRSIVPDRFVF